MGPREIQKAYRGNGSTVSNRQSGIQLEADINNDVLLEIGVGLGGWLGLLDGRVSRRQLEPGRGIVWAQNALEKHKEHRDRVE